MYRLSFLLCLFVFAGNIAFSQSDSATLVSVNWERTILSPGLVWEEYHFRQNELFHSTQNINFIEILPGQQTACLSVTYSDSLEKTSQLALKKSAFAAINGSFFKMRGADPDYHPALTVVPHSAPSRIDRNRSVVYLRVNDSLISENTWDKEKVRRRHQQGVVSIDSCRVFILNAENNDPEWEKKLNGQDIITTGPVLLVSGKNMKIPDDAFCNDRHPRTAIGKRPDGTIILLVVDGRHAEANGMSMKELQQTLRWIGCTDAINLDGGGSSTLYIKGQPDNGVVNYPTDNKQFDHYGEREVANAILVIPK
ncbi:MAG: phosphodiester glycosidase family protein [Prolixibacteraceae bacterium]|jgi:exopolysaccharide biosynthesis protein|nr:phosphodiester glycosidase family protein [Prolixibacteraceae bacterium]